jgi:hypothetical protein
MKPKPKRSLQKAAVQKTPPAKARRGDVGVGENPKLAALKGAHFTKKDRSARISRALKTLEKFEWDFDLDPETIRWIAEDPDLEYM